MVSLGMNNASDPQIYKVMVPGYFYRMSKNPGNPATDNCGALGVVLAKSPTFFDNSTNQFVYLQASDGYIWHANNMYPILPGRSTYAYIVRGGQELFEWFFVPTVLSASMHIHSDSFCVPVGGANSITLSGAANEITVSAMFDGDWRGTESDPTFMTTAGWNVADLDKITFVANSTAKEDILAVRRGWLENLDADYVSTTDSGDVIYDLTPPVTS